MAQANRRFSGDVSVLTVGGTDIIGMFKNVSLRLSNKLMQSEAVKDQWEYPVTRKGSWQIDIKKAVETETSGTSMIGLFGSAVAVVFTSDDAGGIAFSGTAVVSEYTGDFPDEAQEQGITLMGRGAPTIAYTP